MNVLMYCHNSLGIGHLARTLRFAQALLREGARVTVVCGGRIPAALPIPTGVNLVPLPGLSMHTDTDGLLHTDEIEIPVERVLAIRRERVVQLTWEIRPDIVLVEMFPFGRRKFIDEIRALIETARAIAPVRVISSVRDVLVSRPKNQHAYDQRAVAWLNELFDAVLVHSDSSVISLATTFTAYSEIRIPIHYTGYIAAAVDPVAREPLVVVSAGGGRVGARLLTVVSAAAPELWRRLGLRTMLISAVDPTEASAPMAVSDWCCRQQFVSDLPGLMARSSLSISQCGYNTATDVLAARVPAVFVPFETALEDEQLRRAQMLEERQRSICLREQALSIDSLLDAAIRALACQTDTTIALDGARQSARLVRSIYGS